MLWRRSRHLAVDIKAKTTSTSLMLLCCPRDGDYALTRSIMPWILPKMIFRYSHSNAPPEAYVCQICNFSGKSQASLLSHLRKHDGHGDGDANVTPKRQKLCDATPGSKFTCPSCEYSTTFKHHFNRHLSLMHPSEVRRQVFMCSNSQSLKICLSKHSTILIQRLEL